MIEGMKQMKAVIMAGGEGTRLRPLTCSRPKPMVPVANKPVMEHILELLKKHDINDIAVTLQYLPDLIREYFDDGKAFGMKMRYYVEQKPLGTAGSVKNAEDFLDDTFLVISGDALTDIDLGSAIAFHKSKGAIATLVLKRVDIPLEYGVVVTDDTGRIVRFLEKPSWGEVFSDTVNTGIYILSPEIFSRIKNDEVYDFSKDLFPALLKDNCPLYGYITNDYWCDIGDIGAYMQANRDVLSGSAKVTVEGVETSPGIWIGNNTVIEDGVRFEAPCIIGSGCHIGQGSRIGRFTVIGDNNIVSVQCGIKRSIIGRNCSINSNVQLRGGIICNHVHLKQDVSAFEQSVVGDYSIIGEQVTIRPNVKIWPDKSIGQGMEVKSNMVWGSKIGRQLFGNRGVTGEINVEITPEFAARLGAAYGAVNGNKGTIGISSDDSPAAMMIMNAFVSGMLSSGVQASDFGRLLLPAIRSAVRFYRLDGGVHISTCAGANSRLMLDFFDKRGCNIDRAMEKKIENVFVRDDFSRCGGDCLKSVTKVAGFSDFYLKNIINSVQTSKLNYRIALNTGSEFIFGLMKTMLEELGCEVESSGLMPKENTYEGDTDNQQKDKAWHAAWPAGAGQFCSQVKHGRFDLGVSIEEACEKMMLVDAKGRLITDDMFIALISIILFKSVKGRTVVVPVSASGAVDKLADMYDGRVVRTKTGARDIMGRLLGRDAKEELLEQFTMHFDAVAGLVKLLDFMAINKMTLSEMVDMIPEIHMHRQEVECSWNAKGKVIRKLIQENNGTRVDTLEGVKVYSDNGWVLVLPDAERPMCSVIGESVSTEFAEELTNIYARKVREISRS
jgi:mannose-1-phosphate guanylyltransferase/phosphomannomutase